MCLLHTDRLQAMWPTKTTEKEEGMETSLSQQELWIAHIRNQDAEQCFSGYKSKKYEQDVTADNYIHTAINQGCSEWKWKVGCDRP